MPDRPEHLPELDLLRAVALLAVALIHALAWITPADAPPAHDAAAVTIALARFCVPAFVFASGFALFHAYGSRPVRAGAFLRRRYERVLLPWLCFVPVFYGFDRLTSKVDAPGAWLAWGPGHLYYLLLIAQLYGLFTVLHKTKWGLRRFTIAAVGLQLALMAWRSHAPLPGGWLIWPGTYLAHEEAPFWAGTFALGCLAAAEWPRLSRLTPWWPAALSLSIAAGWLLLLEARTVPSGSWYEGNGAYIWPSRLAQTGTWAITLLLIGRRFGWLARWQPARVLSRHSLGLYVLHPIPLTLLGPISASAPAALRTPLLAGAGIGGAYVMVGMLARSRWGALAIGETPRQSPAGAHERRRTSILPSWTRTSSRSGGTVAGP